MTHANTALALQERGIGRDKRGRKAALQEASDKATDGREIRRYNQGLTLKQEAFAINVACGMTMAASYREAYDAEDMKPSSIHNAASLLMDRPQVAQRINAILEDRYNKSLIHNVKHVRQHVFDVLMDESMNRKNPPSVRVQAAVWLGKVDVVGMFKENIEATMTEKRTADEITEEIKLRLAKYLASHTIDN